VVIAKENVVQALTEAMQSPRSRAPTPPSPHSPVRGGRRTPLEKDFEEMAAQGQKLYKVRSTLGGRPGLAC
jgi:hypothetical protein